MRMWLAATRVRMAPGRRPVASHRLAGGRRGERARRRDAERRHRLADEVLAQDGPERGATVAASRERGAARALELDVPSLAVLADDLAEQDRASVAQLPHERAELVARVGERQGLRARRNTVAREDLCPLGRRERRLIQPELGSERTIDLHDRRFGDRRGIHPGIEAVGQARVRVVEGEQAAPGNRSPGPVDS